MVLLLRRKYMRKKDTVKSKILFRVKYNKNCNEKTLIIKKNVQKRWHKQKIEILPNMAKTH